MTQFKASIAAAVLLLSGTAFAGSLQRAAGEGPFFNDAPVLANNVTRAEVRADAARHMPVAGELSAQAEPVQDSSVTRAEVRESTRQAIAHGYRVAAGENA